jgi:hypothetical protein
VWPASWSIMPLPGQQALESVRKKLPTWRKPYMSSVRQLQVPVSFLPQRVRHLDACPDRPSICLIQQMQLSADDCWHANYSQHISSACPVPSLAAAQATSEQHAQSAPRPPPCRHTSSSSSASASLSCCRPSSTASSCERTPTSTLRSRPRSGPAARSSSPSARGRTTA